MYAMMKSVSRLVTVILFTVSFFSLQAQSSKKETKPYKVITSGRQLTIKSSKTISNVMVWTTDGNRVVEQKKINNTSFTIDIPVYRKAFYLMIGLTNGKIYTEKNWRTIANFEAFSLYLKTLLSYLFELINLLLYSLFLVSITIVTGPSFTNSTFISAPNSPVPIFFPRSADNCSIIFSYKGTAISGLLALI